MLLAPPKYYSYLLLKPTVLCGALGLNSGPQIGTASTLPTRPAPQPNILKYFKSHDKSLLFGVFHSPGMKELRLGAEDASLMGGHKSLLLFSHSANSSKSTELLLNLSLRPTTGLPLSAVGMSARHCSAWCRETPL